jgi:predicted NBD/HSP70 family sugar kinase
MYLGIDVGGTKTLVASLTNDGVITESKKFPTPKVYHNFILELRHTLATFEHKDFKAAGIAVPGVVDRHRGIGMDYGNLPWHDVHIQADLERIIHAPVLLENDANAGAVSESMLLKHKYETVLYIAIGTGIGTGVTINNKLAEGFEDMEGGLMLFEHRNKLVKWESFASGHAIYERFGKKASEINDAKIWKIISRDLALGIIDLIAVVQPDAIVLGGGIGTHFPKYKKWLLAELEKYETPLTKIPAIRQAQRPEEAVVYGCYDLAKAKYGNIT